jgi:hypothetical protein
MATIAEFGAHKPGSDGETTGPPLRAEALGKKKLMSDYSGIPSRYCNSEGNYGSQNPLKTLLFCSLEFRLEIFTYIAL